MLLPPPAVKMAGPRQGRFHGRPGHAARGGRARVTITEVTDEEITLDANHPLAGKELTFEIEIVSVN